MSNGSVWTVVLAVMVIAACGGGGGGGASDGDVVHDGVDAVADLGEAVAGDVADQGEATTGDAGVEAEADPGGETGVEAEEEQVGDGALAGEEAPAADVDDSGGSDTADAGAEHGAVTPCDGPGDECPVGSACLPDLAGDGWVCVSGGGVPVRGECGEGVGECVAGAICVGFDETHSYCRSLCTFDDKLACPESYEMCMGDPATAGSAADIGVCLGDPCTPPANGCAEGARCTVLIGQVFACVPEGPVPVDGDCEEEDCVAGAICKHVDAGGYVCRELCQATQDCTPPQRCLFPFTGIDDWGWCEVPACDPVAQTGCKPGEACYYEDPEEGSTLCWAAGSLPVGADCSNLTQFCIPGADCFPDPGSEPDFTYHCYAYCDDAHPCASGACVDTPLMRGVKLCM